jgi:DNA-binding NarL/FixJ family response regulator
MSKKRPSQKTPPKQALMTQKANASLIQDWTRRVFHNSYTYQGRLVKVKGWSVKIQYRRRRQTFTLQSEDRAGAGREAAELYQRLLAQGWSSVMATADGSPVPSQDGVLATPRLCRARKDRRYWQERLVRRNYPKPAESHLASAWSVHMEHEGISHYLSLGTSDASTAATNAAAIYRQIAAQGWAVAAEHLYREITLGIHWSINPVAWTYSTFHTEPAVPADLSDVPNPSQKHILRIGILESDAGIRRALCRQLRLSPVPCSVESLVILADAIQEVARHRVDLWLINSSQSGMSGQVCFDQMKRRVPGLCGLLYSVFEDSNQLFLGTPGGISAYLLKRTPPNRLLEPILHTLPDRPISMQGLLARVKHYYQDTLQFAEGADAAGKLTHLTAREHQILDTASKGATDKEIASQLGISVWTVRDHFKHIFTKLNVHTRTEAVVKIIQK